MYAAEFHSFRGKCVWFLRNVDLAGAAEFCCLSVELLSVAAICLLLLEWHSTGRLISEHGQGYKSVWLHVCNLTPSDLIFISDAGCLETPQEQISILLCQRKECSQAQMDCRGLALQGSLLFTSSRTVWGKKCRLCCCCCRVFGLRQMLKLLVTFPFFSDCCSLRPTQPPGYENLVWVTEVKWS